MWFQSSSLLLMTLDSWVIQLDFHEDHLLVSTLTRCYVCNTYLETCIQVGKKLRNGEFGSCFCLVNKRNRINFNINEVVEPSEINDLEEINSLSQSFEEQQKVSLECAEEAEVVNVHPVPVNKEYEKNHEFSTKEWRGFCARPGSRLWEIDKNGQVLMTHQLKNAMSVPSSSVITFTDDRDPDIFNDKMIKSMVMPSLEKKYSENSLLKENCNLNQSFNDKKSINNQIYSSSPGYNVIPSSVSFRKLLPFYDNYLLAISSHGIYIVDPLNSKVLVWTQCSEEISSIKICRNIIIYSTTSAVTKKLIVSTLDVAILILHSKSLYRLCAKLCLQNSKIFTFSKLLIHMGQKVIKDVLNNIENKDVYNEILKIKKSYFPELDDVLDSDDITYNNKEINDSDSLLTNSTSSASVSPPSNDFPITRRSTEKIRKKFRTADNSPERENSMNKHFSSSYDMSKIYADCIYNVSNRIAQDYTWHNFDTSYSSKHDSHSSKSSCDSFFSSFQDFDCKEISHNLSKKEKKTPSGFHRSHSSDSLTSKSVHGFGYGPILHGTETANAIQDLMENVENVTSSVINSISSGTKNFLKNATKKNSEIFNTSVFSAPLSNEVVDGSDFYGDVKSSDENFDSESDRGSEDIVVAKLSNKKIMIQNKLEKCNSSDDHSSSDAEEMPQYFKDLYDLIVSTKKNLRNCKNKSETRNLLSKWLSLYCSTTHKILLQKVQKKSQDMLLDNILSATSFESDYSVCSSEASLNWDFEDLNLDAVNSVQENIIDDITELFILCFKEEIIISTGITKLFYDSYNPPQHHIVTPDHIKQLDSFYGKLINVDCELLKYSLIFEAVFEEPSKGYLLHTWYSLLERMTSNSVLTSDDEITDFFIDLELSLSQIIVFLKKFLFNKKYEEFLETVIKIKDWKIIYCVILLSICYKIQFENDLIIQDVISHVLLQYLLKFSEHRKISKYYLNYWYNSPELQYDIIRAIFQSIEPSEMICEDGRLHSAHLNIPLKSLLKCIFNNHIYNAHHVSELCAKVGFWYGYCYTVARYNLQLSLDSWLPFVLQSFQKSTIRYAFEHLKSNEYSTVFDYLISMTVENEQNYKCLKCKKILSVPEVSSDFVNEDSLTYENIDMTSSCGNSFTEISRISGQEENIDREDLYNMILSSMDYNYNLNSTSEILTFQNNFEDYNLKSDQISRGVDDNVNVLNNKIISPNETFDEVDSCLNNNINKRKENENISYENYNLDNHNLDSTENNNSSFKDKKNSQIKSAFSYVVEEFLGEVGYNSEDLNSKFPDNDVIVGIQDEPVLYGSEVQAPLVRDNKVSTLENNSANSDNSKSLEELFNEKSKNENEKECESTVSLPVHIGDNMRLNRHDCILHVRELWEVVLAEMLRHSGHSTTLGLLHHYHSSILPGYISKR